MRVIELIMLVSLLSGVTTSIFTLLKLFGVIGWSWGWVLSPIIIPMIASTIGGIVLVIVVVATAPKSAKRYPRV
jgi:hypothetical protein